MLDMAATLTDEILNLHDRLIGRLEPPATQDASAQGKRAHFLR